MERLPLLPVAVAVAVVLLALLDRVLRVALAEPVSATHSTTSPRHARAVVAVRVLALAALAVRAGAVQDRQAPGLLARPTLAVAVAVVLLVALADQD
jgi:hypothetical protein